MGRKKPRAVESDEVEVDGRLEEPSSKTKKTGIGSTTTKTDGRAKPSTSKKDVQSSKSKPVKSPLTVPNTDGKPDPKSAGKKQKAIPEPAEADSEESEEEWVGFSHVGEESGEEDEEEGDDSSEEELLHGLSSDDDDQDSSDEEVELPGIDISKLPTIVKDDKIVQQKLEKAKRQPVRISLITPLSWSEFRFRRRRRIGE
jgi:nucleolar protein 15